MITFHIPDDDAHIDDTHGYDDDYYDTDAYDDDDDLVARDSIGRVRPSLSPSWQLCRLYWWGRPCQDAREEDDHDDGGYRSLHHDHDDAGNHSHQYDDNDDEDDQSHYYLENHHFVVDRPAQQICISDIYFFDFTGDTMKKQMMRSK